ncbi:MAG: SRPBCC domain-containing protein [Thermoproteus sp.]
MELRYEGSLKLKDPSNFKKLLDPEVVGRVPPGTLSIIKEGEWYRAKMSVGVGGLRVTMDVRFKYAKASEDGTAVAGSASGLQGAVDFAITFRRQGDEALWSFNGNARGLISVLGKPIVDATARSIIEKVTSNLQAVV